MAAKYSEHERSAIQRFDAYRADVKIYKAGEMPTAESSSKGKFMQRTFDRHTDDVLE